MNRLGAQVIASDASKGICRNAPLRASVIEILVQLARKVGCFGQKDRSHLARSCAHMAKRPESRTHFVEMTKVGVSSASKRSRRNCVGFIVRSAFGVSLRRRLAGVQFRTAVDVPVARRGRYEQTVGYQSPGIKRYERLRYSSYSSPNSSSSIRSSGPTRNAMRTRMATIIAGPAM